MYSYVYPLKIFCFLPFSFYLISRRVVQGSTATRGIWARVGASAARWPVQWKQLDKQEQRQQVHLSTIWQLTTMTQRFHSFDVSSFAFWSEGICPSILDRVEQRSWSRKRETRCPSVQSAKKNNLYFNLKESDAMVIYDDFKSIVDVYLFAHILFSITHSLIAWKRSLLRLIFGKQWSVSLGLLSRNSQAFIFIFIFEQKPLSRVRG